MEKRPSNLQTRKRGYTVMWLKDSKGEKSITATVLIATLGTCLGKLLLAGITVKGISLGDFSGTDFAAIMTPTFAFYWGRRNMQIGGKKDG